MDTTLFLGEGPGTNMEGPNGATTTSDGYKLPIMQMPLLSDFFTAAGDEEVCAGALHRSSKTKT
eukprot:11768064-Karenia_brevis.AAC.1